MTNNKNPAGPVEFRRIPKQYDSSTLDHSGSIPDDDFDNAVEHNETQHSIPYTADEERALVKKLDHRLVLFVAFLCMLAFLDRSSKAAKSIDYAQYPQN